MTGTKTYFLLTNFILIFFVNYASCTDKACIERNYEIEKRNEEKLTRGRKAESKCMLNKFRKGLHGRIEKRCENHLTHRVYAKFLIERLILKHFSSISLLQ